MSWKCIRFALERILDAPYGAIELIRVPEMLDVLRPVLVQLKLPMPCKTAYAPAFGLARRCHARYSSSPVAHNAAPKQNARDKLYCANAP